MSGGPTIVSAGLVGHGGLLGYAISGDDLDGLEDPGRTVVHMFERGLEAEEAARAAPLAEFLTVPGETTGSAETAYREVIAHLELVGHVDVGDGERGPEQADALRTHLVVLLGEDGRFAEAAADVARLERSSVTGAAEFAAAARAAYGDAESTTAPALLDLPAEGWARRRLLERLGQRAPAPPTARMKTAVAIGASWTVLVLLGVLLAAALLAAPSLRPAPASGRVPAPWPPRDGYAVLLRGPLYGLALLVGPAVVALVLDPDAMTFPFNQASLIVVLPVTLMIFYWLLRPSGLGLLDAFGLRASAKAAAGLLVVGLATLGVDQLGGFGIAHACAALDMDWHWAEGANENLFFGGTGNAVLTTIDTALWAPLFEEIAFRGVLYATLRVHLKPLPAAALSALLFSAIHFYSWPGFFTIVWSGFVWAYAYERSRSLWPCIFAHAMHNGILMAQVFAVYR